MGVSMSMVRGMVMTWSTVFSSSWPPQPEHGRGQYPSCIDGKPHPKYAFAAVSKRDSLAQYRHVRHDLGAATQSTHSILLSRIQKWLPQVFSPCHSDGWTEMP